MLRRKKELVLINSLDTKSIVVVGTGEVYIKGYGTILKDDIVQCNYCCTADCTAQITSVTASIPEVCECPYDWTLTVQAKQGDMNSIFGGPVTKVAVYSGSNNDGSTPTAQQAAYNCAVAINADPYAIVSAESSNNSMTYADFSDGVVVLTEKNCLATHGFDVFIDKGTISVDTAHDGGFLGTEDMAKLFPINWGMQGSLADLPIRGANYCAWTFHLRSASPDTQNIDMDRSYVHYDREVTFYVNSDDTNYAAYWSNKLGSGGGNAALGCTVCLAYS
jgi:hypothetical protein